MNTGTRQWTRKPKEEASPCGLSSNIWTPLTLETVNIQSNCIFNGTYMRNISPSIACFQLLQFFRLGTSDVWKYLIPLLRRNFKWNNKENKKSERSIVFSYSFKHRESAAQTHQIRFMSTFLCCFFTAPAQSSQFTHSKFHWTSELAYVLKTYTTILKFRLLNHWQSQNSLKEHFTG